MESDPKLARVFLASFSIWHGSNITKTSQLTVGCLNLVMMDSYVNPNMHPRSLNVAMLDEVPSEVRHHTLRPISAVFINALSRS